MDFSIERRGRDYWASYGDAPPFFIGRRLRYQGREGLGTAYPGCPAAPIRFAADDYRTRFGIWADVIAPTIACEGGSFTALNSYDRAAFSFGIGQFAAHIPDGDFVRLFRVLLGMPEACAYFPNLRLGDGRICAIDPSGRVAPLEDAASTRALRAWLNPDAQTVGAAELDAAARLTHWTLTHKPARTAQVALMVAGFKRTITRAADHLPGMALTGAAASVIGDLVHHGRAGRFLWRKVAAAAADAEPLARLLDIGGPRWVGRMDGLRAEILSRPILGRHVWNARTRDFVPVS